MRKSAASDVGSLLDGLAAGELAPVYIIHAEDPLLTDRAVAAIRDAAVPPEVRGFNLETIEGKGASAARILGAAQTLPMMAQRRMVMVRDIGQLAAAELGQLVPYLADPCESTVLCATTIKLDKRLKFFQAAKKAGFLWELAPPRNLAAWVKAEVASRKVRMAPEACARLVDVVGKDLSRLSLSIDQLALYADDRAVTVNDVDDLIAETRERSVFELIDAIGAGDARAAMSAVASLTEQRQSPVGVMVMLGRHVRQLSLCLVGQQQRLGPAEMARLVGVPPFVVSKLSTQARRYGAASLARATCAVSEADRALKGMAPMTRTLGKQLGERVILERLVTELVALGS